VLATVNGIRMAYSDSGAGEPVVLLVHGYPLNRSMWDPQLGVLRSIARVVAPDLRGFGASEAGPPGPLTMDQHADDLAALLEVLEIRVPVVFCGLSMGGYVGFAFWRRHGERVGAFVLADTRAVPDTPEGVARRHVIAAEAELSQSSRPAIDDMLPRLFSPHLPLGKGALPEQLTLGMMRGSSARAVADGARGLALRPDSVPDLPSIDVPTLVMVGEHDQLTVPADSELIASRIPHARLVKIDQAGHMSNLENPQAFNDALVDFVRASGDASTDDHRAR